jgi:hypothetical protein
MGVNKIPARFAYDENKLLLYLHPKNERKVVTVDIIFEELPDRNSGHQIDFC